MSNKYKNKYVKKPEVFCTIKEIVSAQPNNERNYFSTNGIPVNKVIVVGMVENKSVGDRASTVVLTDGGRDVLHVTAFGEEMPMVEMVNRGDWLIVVGSLRYDPKRKHFYIIPYSMETVEQGLSVSFMRWWYLYICELRIIGGLLIPDEPCARILDDEGIKYKDMDNGWLKVETIESKRARRISRTVRGSDDNAAVKARIMSYFQEQDDVDIGEYLSWAAEENINASVAEGMLVELTNDGVIKEVGSEHDTFTLVK